MKGRGEGGKRKKGGSWRRLGRNKYFLFFLEGWFYFSKF